MMTKIIFLTGATGNIGARMAGQILSTDSTARLLLLVRGSDLTAASHRVEMAILTACTGLNQSELQRRTEVICGDITRANLGLRPAAYDSLARRITHIIHCAASTKFNLTLPCARQINVTGTAHILMLGLNALQYGNLRGVAHLSTAFVCGYREGKIYEHELLNLGPFCSTYEQTKWEAECLIRKCRSRLPVAVFRPSTVVGDSRTGRTLNFNVLYTPLKFIGMGVVKVLAGSSSVPLDVVPVDYVTAAIDRIFLHSELFAGRTFNLVAGKDKSLTTGEVADGAVTRFVTHAILPRKSRVRFVPQRLVHSIASLLPHRTVRILERLKTYEPHLRLKREFDDTNTRTALEGTGITVPHLADYFEIILDHCIQTEWGRKALRAA